MGNKQKKGMPKGLKVILEILLVISMVCIGQICTFAVDLVILTHANRWMASAFSHKEDEYKIPSDVLTEWASMDSDIAGMTVLDKYEMGLATNAGSDTDGDGLTDQEEIEIYGSNPLAISSAGDLYTDEYKVEHDMDVNTYYEYEDFISYPYNECPEVTLEAESPVDFNAVVKQVECDYLVNGQQVLAQYHVYNYSGILTINAANITSAYGLNATDLMVVGTSGDSLRKYSCRVDGNSLVFRNNLSCDETYDFYIVEKTTWTNFAITIGGVAALSTPAEDDEVTGAGLVLCSPIISYINPKFTVVYYEDLNDDAKNEILKGKVIGFAQIIDPPFQWDANTTIEVKWDKLKYNCINRYVIDYIYQYLCSSLPEFNLSTGEGELRHCLFYYYSYEERMLYDNTVGNPEYSSDLTGFNVYEDALPFGNFITETGPTGNCAGMTHLTTYLYNTGSYPATGSYTANGYDVSWDLTTDSENATLMDRVLYDYKTVDFVDENRHFANGLSEGEEQFANMISAAYLEGNDWFNFYYYYIYGGTNSTVEYDYSLITAVEQYLERGKLLDVQLRMNDGSGHALVIYDYQVDESNPDVVWFKVYDPNYPGSVSENETVSEVGFRIKVTRVKKQLGDGYTFTYEYAPFTTSNYGASSIIQDYPFIMIMDENWHLLND